jgi:hypothetical protein
MMGRISSGFAILLLWPLTLMSLCHAFPINSKFEGLVKTHRVDVTERSKHPYAKARQNRFRVIYGAELSDDTDEGTNNAALESSSSGSIKMSLEAKMKKWEASEEEIKAATLGGVIPESRSDNRERSGAFDVGLYIAFPIMVITGLIFALFPFIMGNLDVNSVGPPPTV